MSSPVNVDVVVFEEIRKSYAPGERLEVSYAIQASSELKPATRDWVGLFRVGWSSSRDYYTFEWVTQQDETMKGTVSFAGRRLPPEDKHFYQFCYVSSDGRVRGASSPFQFCISPALTSCVDDLELVEVSEDSLMIIRPRDKEPMTSVDGNDTKVSRNGLEVVENDSKEVEHCPEEIQNDSGEIQNGSQVVENELQSGPAVKVESNLEMTWKFELIEREVVQKNELLDEMETKMKDMERQLQVRERRVCVGGV